MDLENIRAAIQDKKLPDHSLDELREMSLRCDRYLESGIPVATTTKEALEREISQRETLELEKRTEMAAGQRHKTEVALCREDFKRGQMRASKGGQAQSLRIWSRRAGRSVFLGSCAKMLMEPLGCWQWMMRVPGLTPTRKRWWPTGTRPSGPTLSGVRALQM